MSYNITFRFEDEGEYRRILSMILNTNQFGWNSKKGPNTFLFIRAIDEFCDNNKPEKEETRLLSAFPLTTISTKVESEVK